MTAWLFTPRVFKSAFAAAVVLTISATAALADAQSCYDKNLQPSEEAECVDDLLKQADKQLNAIWAKAIAKAKADDQTELYKNANPGMEEHLRASQRAWLPFRDAQCALASMAAYGGTAEIVAELDCTLKMTLQRTKDLQFFTD